MLNQQNYKPFFKKASIDFEQEAEKHRQHGVYTTSLGDAMLLGLSNLLHLQITVFTSIPSWPHFTIYPNCSRIQAVSGYKSHEI